MSTAVLLYAIAPVTLKSLNHALRANDIEYIYTCILGSGTEAKVSVWELYDSVENKPYIYHAFRNEAKDSVWELCDSVAKETINMPYIHAMKRLPILYMACGQRARQATADAASDVKCIHTYLFIYLHPELKYQYK